MTVTLKKREKGEVGGREGGRESEGNETQD